MLPPSIQVLLIMIIITIILFIISISISIILFIIIIILSDHCQAAHDAPLNTGCPHHLIHHHHICHHRPISYQLFPRIITKAEPKSLL